MLLSRRRLALAAAALGLLSACALPPGPQRAAELPAVVFVHGNGDNAALWTTTLWRFESNGWPRERLHAIDLPLPSARDDDNVPQAGRSSTADHAAFLAAEVEAVLQRTGAAKVVLVGNSRGGNAIRNYVQNLGGAAKVSHAVLGGTPNHGVYADPALRPGSEFNGAGPFLKGLNAPKGPNGDEVTPGLRWMTLRSDNNDKFAQPDSVWLGRPGQPSHVTFDGPALKGALNVVLPARDHREVSTHPEAFARTYEFITGRAPATTAVLPESRVVLDGRLSGIGPGGVDNVPVPGSRMTVYAVDPATGERRGGPLHSKRVGADGRWGPFAADGKAHYEFVVEVPGHAIAHVYRSPFPRSSALVNFRADRLGAADKDAVSVVSFVRPRAYFGVPRDRIVLDGITPPPGVPQGVAGVAASTVRPKEIGRAVVGEFESGAIRERLVGRTWPAAENRRTVLELLD